MHADRLGISVPAEYGHEIWDYLKDRSVMIMGNLDKPDLLRVEGGTLKHFPHTTYHQFSFSGMYLDSLRRFNDMAETLWRFSECPYKITMLHIAHDIREPAEPYLKRLRRQGKTGSLQLTRKKIHPKNVSYIERHNYANPGVSTGTIYLGSSQAEVSAGCYDKRNERIDRGYDDPGPWFRPELRTKNIGATLRDVFIPDSLYWHYMAKIIEPPGDQLPWESHAEDYVLEKPPELLPYQIMKRRLRSSPDIDHLLSLTERMGPEGFETLVRLMKNKRASLQSTITAKNDAA